MRTKLPLFLFIILLPAALAAQTWYISNQAATEWDAVVYEVDPGERVMYRTYLSNSKTDPEKVNPVYIGETAETTYQFTFTEKGSYFVGVRSVVQVEHDGVWEDAAESGIGWSDDPTYAQAGETFGIRYYPAPPVPVGQRPVTE